MNKFVKILRKIAAALIGVPIIIIGIILIPLPGPGLLVVLLGLFILSLEFEWAKPYLTKIQKKVNKIIQKAKDKSPR